MAIVTSPFLIIYLVSIFAIKVFHHTINLEIKYDSQDGCTIEDTGENTVKNT
ncbi:hypothetical protein [Colwellia piezophila]|uniref:hypothetical protein n=1 Tax=Colwellia piezophila TaxID=211668 RepID=UPI0012FC3CB0|nr:hypothetical protein [Colwellia piezophila]